MKIPNLKCAILAGLFLQAAVVASDAATAAWTGTTSTNWATTGNWSASPVPGINDIATFNNAGNGHTTISLGAGVQISNIVFDTASAAAYTIGAVGVGSETLTMNGMGMPCRKFHGDQQRNVQCGT